MFRLDKCNGSCNAMDNLSTKICISSKAKDVNVKVCKMITIKNEVKTLVKHISRNWKLKFNSTVFSSDQQWNNDTCQCECKNYCTCKKV